MKYLKILSLAIIITSTSVGAESFVYITDQVDIPVRSEKVFGDNIVRSLPSGTELSILQATEDGWTQVQYEKTVGWIVSRYLTNNQPARILLKQLTTKNNANKLLITKYLVEKDNLENQLSLLKQENTDLTIQNSKSQAEKAHIEQIYEDALKLEHENEKLMQQMLQLKTELQLSENNNQIEKDTSLRNWFMVGALVLFCGMIIGFILPNLMNRKRTHSNWRKL